MRIANVSPTPPHCLAGCGGSQVKVEKEEGRMKEKEKERLQGAKNGRKEKKESKISKSYRNLENRMQTEIEAGFVYLVLPSGCSQD